MLVRSLVWTSVLAGAYGGLVSLEKQPEPVARDLGAVNLVGHWWTPTTTSTTAAPTTTTTAKNNNKPATTTTTAPTNTSTSNHTTTTYTYVLSHPINSQLGISA